MMDLEKLPSSLRNHAVSVNKLPDLFRNHVLGLAKFPGSSFHHVMNTESVLGERGTAQNTNGCSRTCWLGEVASGFAPSVARRLLA